MENVKNDMDETVLSKREAQMPEGAEPTWEGRLFSPPADIFENEDGFTVVADLPGVRSDDVDVTLEKNVLTIRGKVEDRTPEGLQLRYSEYQVGNFVRSFVVSDEIDRDGIVARSKDGVLTLSLPRKKPTRQRIEVKTN